MPSPSATKDWPGGVNCIGTSTSVSDAAILRPSQFLVKGFFRPPSFCPANSEKRHLHPRRNQIHALTQEPEMSLHTTPGPHGGHGVVTQFRNLPPRAAKRLYAN